MVRCYIRTPDEKLIPHQDRSPETAAKATAMLERLLGVFFKEKSVPILQHRQNMVPQDMEKIQGSSNFIACGLYFDIVVLKMPEAFPEFLPGGVGSLRSFLEGALVQD